MATASGRGTGYRAPCRAFLRGVCHWGVNCHFSHERKPAPLCRHFQNGFCSYGNKCSFQHTTTYLPPDASYYHPGRRVSEPCIVPHVGEPSTGRRGSEPSLFPWHTSGSESQTRSIQSPTGNWALAAEFIPRNAGLVRSVSSPVLMDGSLPKQTEGQDDKPQTSTKMLHSKKGEVPGHQYERSSSVICGICMDKVYDKQVAEERVFGILPNCSHPFCVSCIKRWRNTREFQNEVIKGCPQCRVKSSYFIPHKYWIGDSDEKLKLIEDFKAKTGKIRCRFFIQSNGRCPFKSECIYLHELPHGHQRRRRRDQRRASASALSYSHLVGIYEEDFSEGEDINLLHCALTLALLEDHFNEWSLGFPEEVDIYLGEFSDSD
ncbi:probable E3 ubiquitin-protein ligase makorin-2 [Rana temporaria]|uniref:probable E3 ubiquitin-protein ligase makorin-2 n=1 Tax=Rana temporaria TaxID=8407 RepID=UPI001AADEE04|nr:probable E3 ubiquitin-protein ligase makorin-2 [Rana temporaria]